jgi:hypothetical protein
LHSACTIFVLMKLMTTIGMEGRLPEVGHTNRLMMLGSCFSESIGAKFSCSGFRVDINPFGVLYNPLSVAEAIVEITSDKVYCDKDLFEYNGLWHSYMHHGSFSGKDRKATLRNINERLEQAQRQWPEVDRLFITFGTSYVYSLKSDGRIVSNCHKLPENVFSRRRLSVEEIVDVYSPLISSLISNNRDLSILFTVSPIRHQRDGFHANQLSKSVLLLAIDRLTELFPDNVMYFPAYEIMMDELRDYRYYADDMMHPSDLAVDYIWERFVSLCFNSETKALAKECEDINRALSHRPLHVDDEANKEFLRKIVLKIDQLKEKYPYLEFKKNNICRIQ